MADITKLNVIPDVTVQRLVEAKKEFYKDRDKVKTQLADSLSSSQTKLLVVLKDIALVDRQFANDVISLIKSDPQMSAKFALLLASDPLTAKGLGDALASTSPQQGITVSSDFDLMSFLTTKHAGVPTYGWMLGSVGVAGLAYYFLKMRKGS